MTTPAFPSPAGPSSTRPAALIVVNPSGNRTRLTIQKTPFVIGRQSDCDLVLRDNRVSRQHARIVQENGGWFVEDLGSRHGIAVNGDPVQRQVLKSSDRIEFGFADAYKITFLYEDDDLSRLLQQIQTGQAQISGGANLSKLRAVVEVARTLHNSLAIEEVLAAVVDAAVTITATERGFLFLRNAKDQPLEVRIKRDQRGMALLSGIQPTVSPDQVEAALKRPREFLMLDLQIPGCSVVAVPLVRARAENVEETQFLSRGDVSAGVIVLEGGKPDLSQGNSELLQTLALEASTILENARLLEEERSKQRLEEELDIARRIQQDMLPQKFPVSGWFRAMGSSIPSHTVGGDYFDLHHSDHEDIWCMVVADASGKGVGPAILASILQGAFLAAPPDPERMPSLVSRMNRYVCERAEGERYATLFYALLNAEGVFSWVNAGHCPPIVVKPDGRSAVIEANSLPVGMVESAEFEVQTAKIDPGDKIVIYSDGLTDAQNLDGQFFGARRVRRLVQENALLECQQLHDTLVAAAKSHTEGTFASDDITVLVVEYQPHNKPM